MPPLSPPPSAQTKQRVTAAALSSAGGVLAMGCSLLFELSNNQCTQDGDCGFAASEQICQQGLCVPDPLNNVGGSSGADMGLPDAGLDDCSSNAQCIGANANQPFICQEGTCVDVRGPGCIVLDDDQLSNLSSDAPILVGAYTSMPALNRARHQITLNYQMAVDEFHQATLGVPSASGGRHRIVPVACDAEDLDNFDATLDHLIETLKVPGIVAPLYAAQLQKAFEEKGLPKDVFFLSPWEADGLLSGLPDNGLLWHLLGSTDELAKAYLPLVERTEAFLRADPMSGLPADLRISWVENDQRFMTELSGAVFDEFVAAKGNNLRLHQVVSDITDPDADHSGAIQAIVDFQPHIVVSLTGGEFVTDRAGGIMRGVEAAWPSEVPNRPFYLLSPWHAASPDLYNYIAGFDSSVAARIAGVNFSVPEDTRIVDTYQSRFNALWGNSEEAVGFENYYDAMYFMIYSIAASRSAPQPTGLDLARGMKLLVNTDSGQGFDIDSAAQIMSALNNSVQGVSVNGTLGAPNFNVALGARLTPGGVYCVNAFGDFFPDALRYTAGSLTGNLPCIVGF